MFYPIVSYEIHTSSSLFFTKKSLIGIHIRTGFLIKFIKFLHVSEVQLALANDSKLKTFAILARLA